MLFMRTVQIVLNSSKFFSNMKRWRKAFEYANLNGHCFPRCQPSSKTGESACLAKEHYCPSELPPMSNAQPGEVKKRAIDSVVDYTCQKGYEPSNSPSAKCVASSENEGKWELHGDCVGIFSDSISFFISKLMRCYAF